MNLRPVVPLLIAALALGVPSAYAVEYPRQDRVAVEMRTAVALDSTRGFKFTFSVRSLPESVQRVWQFGLDVPISVTASGNVQRLVTTMQRKTIWMMDHPGFGGTNWLTWYGGTFEPDDHGLKPGEGVSGLEIFSEGLPGIRPMLALGWVPREQLPNPEDLDPERPDTPGQLTGGEDPVQHSFHGSAVGPEILPTTASVSDLLDRLIVLKDQGAKLGWIKDPGVVTSLNQKLANARKALDRLFGGKKAARGILGAFVNELDALRGKQVDDNAYFLLRVNAEYLIVRMGGTVPASVPAK